MASAGARIALFLPELHGGGAEAVARAWARHLTTRGHDVSVLVTLPRPATPVTAGFAVRAVCDDRTGRSPWAGVRGLRRALQRDRPDVVVAFMPYWNLVALAAVRSLPRARRPRLVLTEHNVESQLVGFGGLGKRGLWWASRWGYRHADRVLAVSHAVATDLLVRHRVPRDRVRVVHLPVHDPAAAAGAAPAAPPAGPGLDVVVPARLVDFKRPVLAVGVAARLGDLTGAPVRLHLFGDGPLRAAVAAAGDRAGVDVRLHGWVEHWTAACPPGAVVLLPSAVEGFGMVLVEAAAHGLPVAVSSLALGAADAVVPGVTGVLAGGEDVDDLARAVLAARALPPADVTGWLAHFDAEHGGRRLEAALADLLPGAAAGQGRPRAR